MSLISMGEDGLWIFSYGSLCWRPGFEYEEMSLGYVKGFVRRFWQGNTVHRGTVERPGRVATLVREDEGKTYGCAFRVKPENCRLTLTYLDNRETKLGGYDCVTAPFHPCDKPGESVQTLLYVALPGNVDWIGPSDLSVVADDVISASGICGSNLDYVTNLVSFLKHHKFEDEHLFELDSIIAEKLQWEDSKKQVIQTYTATQSEIST